MLYEDEFEDTKRVISIRSSKDTQHKTQWPNNYLLNTKQKNKDRAAQTPLIYKVKSSAPEE